MRHEQHDFAPYWEQAFIEGIKKERLAQGMSQADLAERMSDLGYRFDQATVYKVENGKRKVTAAEAWGLAEVLDVDVEYLYDWQAAHQHPDARRKLLRTRADKIFRELLALDDAARRLSWSHRAFVEAIRHDAEQGLTLATPGNREVPVDEYYEPLLSLSVQNEVIWRLRSEVWIDSFDDLAANVSGLGGLADENRIDVS